MLSLIKKLMHPSDRDFKLAAARSKALIEQRAWLLAHQERTKHALQLARDLAYDRLEDGTVFPRIDGRRVSGFTLIELMIVVGIVALLAAIAVPAYQSYTTRAKLTEGLNLAAAAETAIADGYTNNGAAGLVAAAHAFNTSGPSGSSLTSKYIASILVGGDPTTSGAYAANPGLIAILFRDASTGLATGQDLLTITPNIAAAGGTGPEDLTAAIADGSNGPMDFACASATNKIATSQNLVVDVQGTVLGQYAPSSCQ